MGIKPYNYSIRKDSNRVAQGWASTAPKEVTKTYVVQEREVSYRFTLHQHPYLGNLTQRLLHGGVAGLQAADTDYQGRAARPDSVLFEIGAVPVALPPGTRLALVQDTTVTAGGAPFDLAAGMSVTLAAAGPTPVQAHALPPVGGAPPAVPRLRGRLLGGLDQVPARGETLPLAAGRQALVQGNTLVKLNAATQVRLADGSVVNLKVNTPLALADGATITLPNAIDVTVVRARRLPKLYAPALTAYAPTALVERPYPVRDLDFTLERRVRGLQLGAVLPRAAHDRDPPEQERALRRGAALVPLPVRPDRRQRRAHARALLEGAAVPDDRRQEDRGDPGQPGHRTRTRTLRDRDRSSSIDAWKDAPFRPHVDRPLPPAGVHVQDGDGLPGQPDRLGRFAVPPGHRRDHRRGDDALRAGRATSWARGRRPCRRRARCARRPTPTCARTWSSSATCCARWRPTCRST